MTPDPLPSAPGRVLAGRYQLTGLIASGDLADVWEANDNVLTRSVAVKTLHDSADEALRRRFTREAVEAARLSHPNIVAIYDTGADGRTPG